MSEIFVRAAELLAERLGEAEGHSDMTTNVAELLGWDEDGENVAGLVEAYEQGRQSVRPDLRES